MKKKKAATKTAKKTGSWSEDGEKLLKNYLKKAKGAKGRIAVLTQYGDVILNAGQNSQLDWTSIGSLLSAVMATNDALAKALSCKSHTIQFGEASKGCWVEVLDNQTLIFGVGIAYKPADLKLIYKHIKTRTMNTAGAGGEALAGLNEMSIEAALGKKI